VRAWSPRDRFASVKSMDADRGKKAVDLYLELLKRCLTRCGEEGAFLADAFAGAAQADRARRGLAVHPDADTMVGWARLENIRQCAERVLAAGVPGDFIEAGVWRGGSCIFMAGILDAHGVDDRRVWLADSFAGFPELDRTEHPQDALLGTKEFSEVLGVPLAVGQDEVRQRFQRYGLLSERVRFLPGFFDDTLASAPIDRLALMRLDGDYYLSTRQALEALYPRLSVGGFCIVDDYLMIPTCRRAVDEYRRTHRITDRLCQVDWNAVYWQRTA
jgi:hypothetical protein